MSEVPLEPRKGSKKPVSWRHFRGPSGFIIHPLGAKTRGQVNKTNASSRFLFSLNLVDLPSSHSIVF